VWGLVIDGCHNLGLNDMIDIEGQQLKCQSLKKN
jgi:hypothetical protein